MFRKCWKSPVVVTWKHVDLLNGRLFKKTIESFLKELKIFLLALKQTLYTEAQKPAQILQSKMLKEVVVFYSRITLFKRSVTAQKMKFSIKDVFRKCDH